MASIIDKFLNDHKIEYKKEEYEGMDSYIIEYTEQKVTETFSVYYDDSSYIKQITYRKKYFGIVGAKHHIELNELLYTIETTQFIMKMCGGK